jgi:hypothetical protein
MGFHSGKRVEDSEMILGKGTVIEHDAVEVLVKWDNDPEPMWSRWADVELVREEE